MNRKIFFIVLGAMSLVTITSAQRLRRPPAWETRSNLVIGIGGSFTKYIGEFTDHYWDGGVQLHAKYFFVPEFSLGLDGGFGSLIYNRRTMSKFRDAYFMQFYADPVFLGARSSIDPIMGRSFQRFTSFSFLELRTYFNMAPRTRINPYFSVGVGMFMYVNDDENLARAAVRFDHQPYLLVDPMNGEVISLAYSSLGANDNVVVSLPVGAGVDIRVTESFAFFFDVSYRFLFGQGSDHVDAFGEEMLNDFVSNYRAANRATPTRVVPHETSDSFATVTLGIEFFLPLQQQQRGMRRR